MKTISLTQGLINKAERGMTTAEYTVGTVGACTIGGVLVKVGQSQWFGDLVQSVLEKIPSILPF